ncbi:hypothetical protein [Schlesneria paludicola]|uniref:hypothetical protein n=1 Tax=Schlesneria paludicola TaxID=360056 RepID=UPI00029B5095|nr:hypothetical protein [Schlesneria paludicola]
MASDKNSRWVMLLVVVTLANSVLAATTFVELSGLKATVEQLKKETDELRRNEELRDKPQIVPLYSQAVTSREF